MRSKESALIGQNPDVRQACFSRSARRSSHNLESAGVDCRLRGQTASSINLTPSPIRDMETLDGTEWDVVLSGTGLITSLLAL